MSRFSDCFLLLFGQLAVGGVIGLAVPPFSLIDRGFYRSSAGLFLAFAALFLTGKVVLLARGDAGAGSVLELTAWGAFSIALAAYTASLWGDSNRRRARAFAAALLLGRTESLYAWVLQNSQVASHYVDGDTLTLLGDLSLVHRALALAIERYAEAIESLAPFTDNAVLRDATAAMLQLTRDVGAMSARIVEMGDKIIVMADDVGVMAGRIVATQELQQANVTLTQGSLLTAQAVAIAAISDYGL
jgi:hypothetical protein